MVDLSKEKLKLDYPCSWEYRLITYTKEDALKGIKETILEREFTLKTSNVSTKGKFQSFILEIIVHNEDDRVTIYELLGKHDAIKMVL
ncbi:MAG: YbeD family protein [Candidatus Marinarcus sp.]|uniref:HP0495 family protein n=1 Tax=Candidatus Marinarcus sp. TaxID=3100987 RepID=UPI003B008FFA